MNFDIVITNITHEKEVLRIDSVETIEKCIDLIEYLQFHVSGSLKYSIIVH